MLRRAAIVVTLGAASALGAGCASTPARDAATGPDAVTADATARALRLQSAVMSMADEWNAALGEANYAVESLGTPSLRERWMAQGLLRNGFGASLDIASGPNPAIAMMDMLVLSTLQTWTVQANWAGSGLSREGAALAVARMSRTRDDLWKSAAAHFPEPDLRRLRGLIDAWIAAHPDQMLVSFVRLSDFAGSRNLLTLREREAAGGLLRELDDVTGAVDEARLLGERALWYAARYPYVIGQQAELTGYRMAEVLEREVGEYRQDLFASIAEERKAIIESIGRESKSLQPVLVEARATVAEAQALSAELLKVVNAIDGLVERFDHDGSEGGLTVADLERLLAEAGETAGEARRLVEASGELVDSERWPAATASADAMLTGLVNRAVLGLAGVALLAAAAFAVVRRIPPRN